MLIPTLFVLVWLLLLILLLLLSLLSLLSNQTSPGKWSRDQRSQPCTAQRAREHKRAPRAPHSPGMGPDLRPTGILGVPPRQPPALQRDPRFGGPWDGNSGGLTPIRGAWEGNHPWNADLPPPAVPHLCSGKAPGANGGSSAQSPQTQPGTPPGTLRGTGVFHSTEGKMGTLSLGNKELQRAGRGQEQSWDTPGREGRGLDTAPPGSGVPESCPGSWERGNTEGTLPSPGEGKHPPLREERGQSGSGRTR